MLLARVAVLALARARRGAASWLPQEPAGGGGGTKLPPGLWRTSRASASEAGGDQSGGGGALARVRHDAKEITCYVSNASGADG